MYMNRVFIPKADRTCLTGLYIHCWHRHRVKGSRSRKNLTLHCISLYFTAKTSYLLFFNDDTFPRLLALFASCFPRSRADTYCGWRNGDGSLRLRVAALSLPLLGARMHFWCVWPEGEGDRKRSLHWDVFLLHNYCYLSLPR